MRMVLAVLCTALLAGCGSERPLAERLGQPTTIRVSGVPFHPQDGFGCGTASLAMMLEWSGLHVGPKDLEGQLAAGRDDPRTGMIDTARRWGRLSYAVKGSDAMMAELAAGHPVLILENLGLRNEPMWNCPVAIGYDRERGDVLMHSGVDPAKRTPVRLLRRLWSETDEWGLVVLPPGDLPAMAERDAYLEATAGLEQAGRHWEAVMAYDAALSRWPADAGVLMGLGSSLYQLGDPQGAADAYQAASALAPDPGPALDKLAQVLAGLGRRDEAVAAATKAVALGGPMKASYEKTLKDVTKK
ncbi:MAG: PA2778 family cysteine peptidase [Solirubrobacterales bacterium]